MRNGKIVFGVLFAGLLGAIVFCGFLSRTTGKLQAENQALRAEINELNAAAQIAPPEPDQALAAEFETQKRELLRLRNEVAQLRASRAEEELSRARSVRSQAASTTGPATFDGQSVPSADWTFMGYDTPQAALISGLSAMKTGQLASLLDTFTPQERQRFEAMMQGKSESEIAERFQKEFGKVSGLRVVGQQELPSGEVVLDVYMEGVGRLKKYRMSQVNNEWKAAGPINQNFAGVEPQTAPGPGESGMAYYMSNPELMKRYFPQMYEMMQKGQEQQAANGQSQAVAENHLGPAEPQTAPPGMLYYMSNPELMKRYFPQMYEKLKNQKAPRAADGQSQAVPE